MSDLSMIWAENQIGVIGADGDLPWYIPEDLQRFRELTEHQSVIMGSKTWLSLPDKFRPLPARHNIVMTRYRDSWSWAGIDVVDGLPEALEITQGRTPFVIGGADVLRQALPLAVHLHVTEVKGRRLGDRFSPTIPHSQFTKTIVQDWTESKAGSRETFRFVQYERIEL